MSARHLTCCVCGNDAGLWKQHWNRDTGFGICRRCVDWLRTRHPDEATRVARGESDEDLASCYGVEGVNYAPAADDA